ncbi:peptide/nickel transport system substrate-binding protein [Spinactinospora alkalitolerans]|uniref:Peptide/nickel transport system substrate-binding protein n=1 Tax=Spinactinospora alkalitolerans TaxID=687207 RepID=A0A852TXU2_9ACTN|nr:peptide ABC transporter substrate-binding protein [Spinactinospora alkalitolerans]NYE48107.1 peptide/nickel transport system substrate-binding protein [Spinactinospora alkalitolerans]
MPARAVSAAVGALVLTAAGCAPGGAGSPGSTAVIALIQEPGVLSPMFSNQSGSDISDAFVVEPLFLIKADGTHEPLLAETVPTADNGGVSQDGLTVTYTLREGITWSDGEALTADDLAFTAEVAQDPDAAAFPDPEYASIDSTEVVDELTLEVTMKEPQPGYLNLFQQVLPEHMFESSAVRTDDPQARLPLGTGPFAYEDWQSGNQITLTANDDYWRDPEQPALDGVTLKITPDKQAALSGFTSGQYDSVFFFTAGDLAELSEAEEAGAPVTVATQPETTGIVEWLWLNHSDGGDLDEPHPVLGDPAVREAIDLGLDRRSIIDDVLGGFGTLSGSFLYAGFGSAHREPSPHDPDEARAVLDDAGWEVGDGGIREKDGVPARLTFQTISGDQTRALYQQTIQQDMKDIGIELVIENVPSNSLFDSRDKGGLLATGDFDIAMSRDGHFPDPAIWMEVFTTGYIPTEENPVGFSYSHWSDDEFDALEREAATTMDPEARKEALREADRIFTEDRVAIPVYASAVGYAWNTGLDGVEIDYWDGMWTTASSAGWTLGSAEGAGG